MRHVKRVVPPEVMARLREFAAEHGRCWRARLRQLWVSGKDAGLLRQARNIIGPGYALDRIRF